MSNLYEYEQEAANRSGCVIHLKPLAIDIGQLLDHPEYSDVTILVEGKSFPAHKIILASRSEYFRALLFGGMKESSSDCHQVELHETNAEAFKVLMTYIYTGVMELDKLEEEGLLEVLGLAHLYGFELVESAISDYLQAILSDSNVCLVYHHASLYGLKELSENCFLFMDRHASEILNNHTLLILSQQTLKEVIQRDSFCAPELEIFKAVKYWFEQHPDEDTSDLVKHIRLPLMSMDDLLNVVRPSSLISADLILDAIKVMNESRTSSLQYRGYLWPEENVAKVGHGAEVIQGEMREFLLNGENKNYDLDRGFTRHPIDLDRDNGIVVKLGRQHIVNTFRLLLWDHDMRSYSYYIEVSIDMHDWVRVVDHKKHQCRSWQELHFLPRVVKFIKIVGSNNTVNRVFHLVSFECYYKNTIPDLQHGIIVPKENVATIRKKAMVIEGVSRSRNALINGDASNYDWDSGYTCHQLGSGMIVVQLAQPYIIGSLRLLLWDCDGRSYSFFIEVSTDKTNWKRVCDRTKQACRAWQLVTFTPQPVSFIKIVGTHNTANEVFHCVHFECPANLEAIQTEASDQRSDVIRSEHIDSVDNDMAGDRMQGMDLS